MPNKKDRNEFGLTPKQMKIACLIACGYDRESIASSLYIDAKTYDTHRTAILKELKLSNNVDICRWAIREGVASVHE